MERKWEKYYKLYMHTLLGTFKGPKMVVEAKTRLTKVGAVHVMISCTVLAPTLDP